MSTEELLWMYVWRGCMSYDHRWVEWMWHILIVATHPWRSVYYVKGWYRLKNFQKKNHSQSLYNSQEKTLMKEVDGACRWFGAMDRADVSQKDKQTFLNFAGEILHQFSCGNANHMLDRNRNSQDHIAQMHSSHIWSPKIKCIQRLFACSCSSIQRNHHGLYLKTP